MKRIEEYVNFIYRYVDGDRKEVRSLKEEMKAHLVNAVEELKEEGLSEEAAIDMALERFGEERQLTGELTAAFRNQRIKKRLLMASLILFLAGLVIGTLFYFRDRPYRETYDLIYRVEAAYEQKDGFTDADRRELQSLIEKEAAIFKNISFLFIYHDPQGLWLTGPFSEAYEVFQYVNDDLYLEDKPARHGLARFSGENWFFEWGFVEYSYRFLGFLPYSLLVVSFSLFVAGAVMHVVQRRWFQNHRCARWSLYGAVFCLAAFLALFASFKFIDHSYLKAQNLMKMVVSAAEERDGFTADDFAELHTSNPKIIDNVSHIALFKYPAEVEVPYFGITPSEAGAELVFAYGEQRHLGTANYGSHSGRWCIEYQFNREHFEGIRNREWLPVTLFAAFIVLMIGWRAILSASHKYR